MIAHENPIMAKNVRSASLDIIVDWSKNCQFSTELSDVILVQKIKKLTIQLVNTFKTKNRMRTNKKKLNRFNLRPPGIEPGPPAWKAGIITIRLRTL